MKLLYRLLLLILSLSVLPTYTPAQTRDSSIFDLPVQMDEVVITAIRDGWDVASFIRRVRTDTTFYKAFRSVRTQNYRAENDIRILDKRGRTSSRLTSTTRQVYKNGCRSMIVEKEQSSGDFYKRNGSYRYFTAELYAHLFFTQDTVCDDLRTNTYSGGQSRLERSKEQLKQLVFSPGSRIRGIPLLGNRASVFDAEIAAHYDFSLESVEYGQELCYLFRAVPRAGHEDKVVFRELSTWFRKSDYSILARDYELTYQTVAYDFDVRMQVRLLSVNGILLPESIRYSGNWDIVGRKRERATFTTSFDYDL